MSVFAKYELTTAKREPLSPVINKRRKLIQKLDEQISVIDADNKGETYTSIRKKWVTTDSGERKLIEQKYAPRKWFWERDGRYVCQLKYGNKAIAIHGRHNAIVVDTLKEVREVYNLFRDTANKGEFDNNLTMALARKKKK